MPGLSLTLRPRTHKTRATAGDLLYALAMRAPRLSTVLDGVSVALGSATQPLLLPEECACCGACATHRLALGRNDGVSVLIGYCDDCAEHQASSSSRVLALSLASLLLALVAAAGLPLLLPRLGLFGLVFAVCALSMLPLLALLLPRAVLSAPHTARGQAVFWGSCDRLQCAARPYGERVQQLNGGELQPEPIRERIASAWLSAGPVLGVGAACLSFFVYHPLLRVLNLGTAQVEVAIDGRPLASVDPTSNESPSAGALVRVPAGQHTLSVSSSVDGTALGSTQADFHSGAVHLFAIAADDTCFWLETTGYGREQRTERSYEALRSAEHFWTLPGGIDTWFGPNPEASDPSSHSSGGLLTALRQAPCAEAPPEVRSAQ